MVLGVLMVGGCLAATLSLKASLPPDVNILSPDPSLPEEVKALSGKWASRWNSQWGWDCIICVEKVDKNSAQVVHAWGECVRLMREAVIAPLIGEGYSVPALSIPTGKLRLGF